MEPRKSIDRLLEEGTRLWRGRQMPAAIAAFEEALLLGESIYGAHAPELVSSLTELCAISVALSWVDPGRAKRAIEYGERALLDAATSAAVTNKALLRLYESVGSAYMRQGDHSSALHHLEIALALEGSAEQRWFHLGGILEAIAQCLAALGRYPEAIAYAERRLSTEQAHAPPDFVTRTVAEMLLGSVLLEAGEKARAVPHLERALEALEKRGSAQRFRDELRDLLERARGKQEG